MAFRRSRVRSASAPPIKSRPFRFTNMADKRIVRKLSASVKVRFFNIQMGAKTRSTNGRTLDVIAKHQLLRMRLEVNLSLQIADDELSHIMPKERDRHDQRHKAASIVLD